MGIISKVHSCVWRTREIGLSIMSSLTQAEGVPHKTGEPNVD